MGWESSHCRSHNVPYGQWCTVRDMMHNVRAEPPDRRTRSAGLETGEACQRTSQHRGSKCIALGMAVVLLPHPDRTFPGRGIQRRGSRWWRPSVQTHPTRGAGEGGGWKVLF